MQNNSARFSPCSLLIAFAPLGDRAGALVGGHGPDQSNPKILTVAVGLSPRILYWIFTDLRRPLRPGASFGAVCPPAFMVPTSVSVSSRRLSQPRTTCVICTSAPSTSNFTCLTSFFHRSPWVLISTLGSADLSVLLAHHKPLVSSSGAAHSPQ